MRKKSFLITLFFISLIFCAAVQNGKAATANPVITGYREKGFVSTGWWDGYFKIEILWDIEINSTLIDHFEIKDFNKGGLVGGDYTTTVGKVPGTARSFEYHCYGSAVGHTSHYVYIVAVLTDGTRAESTNELYIAANSAVRSVSVTELKRNAESVTNFLSEIIDWILKIPVMIFNFIMNAATGAINFLSSLITGAITTVQGFGIMQPFATTVVAMSIFLGVYLIIKAVLYLL